MEKSVLATASIPWQVQLRLAITTMLASPEFAAVIDSSHTKDTPQRVVRAFEEYFSGVTRDPAAHLTTSFIKGDYDQMVTISHVPFVSWCAHHFAPFIGTYTFAYIPKRHIVGLSKIPRMIDIFCARPQVQEKLAADVVTLFQRKVKPHGCGISISARHMCACVRGVKKDFVTTTTALKGVFKEPGPKVEFLQAVRP